MPSNLNKKNNNFHIHSSFLETQLEAVKKAFVLRIIKEKIIMKIVEVPIS